MEPERKANDSNWRQAIDPRLLRRLLKPLERPGVIRLEFARGILASFRGMPGGLPLLERMSRYLEGSGYPAAGLPIVHALPARPRSESGRVPTGSVAVAGKILARTIIRRIPPNSPPSREPDGQRIDRTAARVRPIQAAVGVVANQSIEHFHTPVETVRAETKTEQPGERMPAGPSMSVLSTGLPDPRRIALPPGRRRRREEPENAPVRGDSGVQSGGNPIAPLPHPPVREVSDDGLIAPSKTDSPPLNAEDVRNPLPTADVLTSTPSPLAFPVLRVRNVAAGVPQGRPPHRSLIPRSQPADKGLFSLPAEESRWTAPAAFVHLSNKRPASAESHPLDGDSEKMSPLSGNAGKASVPSMNQRLQEPHRRFSAPPASATPVEEERIMLDELVDKALRKLMRNLDVDRERRGWRS